MPDFSQNLPSDPTHTSAASAYTQLSPSSQANHERAHADPAQWKLTEGRQLKPGEVDPFAAYTIGKALDLEEGANEGVGRDVGGDMFRYEIVKGFFRQNDATIPRLPAAEMLKTSFGLIDQSPSRWTNLKSGLAKLNESADEGTSYKLLFVGRHGQGYHNAGAELYTPESWEFHWARLNGADGITWGPDAELTEKGEGQALAVQAAWHLNLAAGCPKPQTFWVSPLTRTGDTMRLSFGELLVGEKPVFTEAIREIFGQHTCDKRRTKSYLEKRFPDYVFEECFSEEDPWWTEDVREGEVERRRRLRGAMDKLFSTDKNTYISLTSHSCAIRSMLAVLNHEVVALETGEMIPVVVKAVRQH